MFGDSAAGEDLSCRAHGSGRPALPPGAGLHFRSMDSILKNQLDRLPIPGDPPAQTAVDHDNIRGADYLIPHRRPILRRIRRQPGELCSTNKR